MRPLPRLLRLALFGAVFGGGAAPSVTAQADSRAAPTAAESARADEARRLRRLSATNVERRLLNDAERQLTAAADLGGPSAEDAAAFARLRERRRALESGDAEKAYVAFLKSDAYRTERARALKDEGDGARRAVDALIDAARRSARAQDAAAEIGAVEAAYDVDPFSPRLSPAFASGRAAEALAARRASRGLGRLTLGKVVAGQDVALADLKNQVVLWRSFSL